MTALHRLALRSQASDMTEPRLGLVARNDRGGIAAQTIDMAQNLDPTATLVVDLGDKGRGDKAWDGYPNPIPVEVSHGSRSWIIDRPAVQKFVSQVDVILSVETFYGTLITETAERHGVPTVRYANPELFRPENGVTQVVLPSTWEAHRFPDAKIIPQAIDFPADRSTIHGDSLIHILHCAAPAMLDRNGTNIFLEALEYTDRKFQVTISGIDDKQAKLIGRKQTGHSIHCDTRLVENRWDQYKPSHDLLVYPRRYGGNSLTLLEAAASGLPILTTNCAPQNRWLPEEALLPIAETTTHAFIGGRFQMHRADPRLLAQRLDRLAADPDGLADLAAASLSFAGSRSWRVLRPLWMSLFRDLTRK